jgi:hypothetical protein
MSTSTSARTCCTCSTIGAGKRPQPATGAHHDGLRDSQRQRQVQQERGARPGPRRDFDPAPERHDFGAHHIHADAATRDLRNFGRRRESGLEDALDQLRVAGLRIRGNATLRHGLGPDAFEIEPRAVVDELDRDLVRDLAHRERDFTGLGLAALIRCGRASIP